MSLNLMGIEIFFQMFLAWGEFYSISPLASVETSPVKTPRPGHQGHRTRPSKLSCKAVLLEKKGICHSPLTVRNRQKLLDPGLSPRTP